MTTTATNETIRKFGYPASLVAEHEHWVVLLRPAAVTLGSLILAARSEATAFGDLPPGTHAELAVVARDLEAMLHRWVEHEKINYLMLMMVDPHVHFHVLPRYAGVRRFDGVDYLDGGWPGMPDLANATALDQGTMRRMIAAMRVAAESPDTR